jgi:hypothetical protein
VTGREVPQLIIEIRLEGRATRSIVAETETDERRLRDWLRHALDRRSSLSDEIVQWLDELDVREAA